MRLILALLFISIIFTSCKKGYSIKGKAYSWDKPAIGMKVSIVNANDDIIKTTTDQDGKFEFNKLKNGKYLIVWQENNRTFGAEDQINYFIAKEDLIKKYMKSELNPNQIEFESFSPLDTIKILYTDDEKPTVKQTLASNIIKPLADKWGMVWNIQRGFSNMRISIEEVEVMDSDLFKQID